MKVKEVSDLTGISVRTLHYYDHIGLLTPDSSTEAGYRLYSEDNLAALQQILFFRELGFPLKKIKELLMSPAFNRQEAFELQRNMLIAKRKHLDGMIQTIEKTIQNGKGELAMTKEEKFKGFDFNKNPYEKEARERWGDTAVNKADSIAAQFGTELAAEMNEIYRKLAAIRHLPPESAEAQAGIEEWFTFLNKMGTYSLQAFAGLGQMYVDDERFTKTIDQFGEGLAMFMCDAMGVYAKK